MTWMTPAGLVAAAVAAGAAPAVRAGAAAHEHRWAPVDNEHARCLRCGRYAPYHQLIREGAMP